MELRLAYGFDFRDLYQREGLQKLDRAFLAHLAEADAALCDRLAQARKDPASLPLQAESDLLIALAPHLEDFVAVLFGIEGELRALAARHNELAPLYSVKRLFVQRRALHKVKPEAVHAADGASLEQELSGLFGEPLTELAFARQVTKWLQDEAALGREL